MKWNTTLAILAIAIIPAPTFAQHERTISVTGYGSVETEPDIAKIELGVFVFDKDLLTAKQAIDEKVSTIVDTLKKLGVQDRDIAAAQLYVNPKYDNRGDSVEFMGYEISRALDITLRRVDRLNVLLDGAIKAGANRIKGIDLTTSKKKELEKKVLTLAIANTKEVANRIASGFDATVGKPLMISVDSGGSGGVRFNMLSSPVFPEANYQPGIIRVSAEIEVVFALAD